MLFQKKNIKNFCLKNNLFFLFLSFRKYDLK
jgi:hypothetical protein